MALQPRRLPGEMLKMVQMGIISKSEARREFERKYVPELEEPAWTRNRSASDEPIVGYKQAQLVLDNDKIMFRSMIHGSPYGVFAEARHASRVGGDLYIISDHKVPDPTGTCLSCGFYAHSEREMSIGDYSLRNGAHLQVELYGTVIKHRRGYRAQYQRVLGVTIAGRCGLCERDADGMFTSSVIQLRPICLDCYNGLVTTAYATKVGEMQRRYRFFKLSDIANALGCDVAWLDTRPDMPLLEDE